MKWTAHHIVIALMAIVIAVLSWTLIYISREDLRLHDEEYDEAIETETTASVEQGRPIVRVDAQSQEASGIRVAPLQTAQYETAAHVFGSVVDIESLLDLRGRYLAASGERRALAPTVVVAESDFRRAQSLYQDDRNISEQAMREAQSRHLVAQARFTAAQSTESVLRDALRSAWGPVVSAWAMTAGSTQLNSLLTRNSVLVQLVLPYELPRTAARAKLTLAPVTARAQAVEARFVSDAPRVSAALPGNTYFYLVKGSDLRAGARVVARVALGDATLDGVIVPDEAVVWHAGKSWIYLQNDAESFGRYEISTANELPGGWFQSDAFEDGARVVISGAQLLLSEELKFQIRNENED